MTSDDAEIRSLAARVGGNALIAKLSKSEVDAMAAKARAAQWQKDLDAVDPSGELPIEERERRAAHRRRERMARAALASAKAKRDRKAAAAAARLASELDALAAIDAASGETTAQ